MPTSSDCSQLQSIMPLNAKVWRVGRDEAVEVREGRRLARPHIGEQDAALLDHRIGLLADIGAHPAALGLGRRLQALALDVEQPAVERAAQAAVLQPPEGQIGAAMRAGALDQAVAALVVAEQHQAFAQQAHRLDRPVAGKLVDQRGRLPVAPHQGAGRRGGAGAGDQVVLLGAQHARGPFVGVDAWPTYRIRRADCQPSDAARGEPSPRAAR